MRVTVLRKGAAALLVAVSMVGIAGCNILPGGQDVTGSIGANSQDSYRRLAETWGKRYQADPSDRAAALNYARALRGLDEKSQAAAVLQQITVRHPDDPEVLAAYGKALVEIGQFDQARTVLARAHSPDMPNPRVLSAQAVIADQSGEHAKAQELYRSALKRVPNDPVILTNLGLSLILSKRPQDAEALLRRAIAAPKADARMRETLAFALVINGRGDEAANVLGVDLPPAAARQKVAELQQSATGEGLMAAARTAQTRETAKPPVLRVQAQPAAKPAAPAPLIAERQPEAVVPLRPAGDASPLRKSLSDS